VRAPNNSGRPSTCEYSGFRIFSQDVVCPSPRSEQSLLKDEVSDRLLPMRNLIMSSLKRMFVSAAAAVLIATGAFACSGGSTPSTPTSDSTTSNSTGGGGGGTSSTMGSLTVRLTDSPFSNAKALLVTFSEVTVHRADPGDWKTLPFASGSSRTCDLKKLNGATDVLGVGSLPAGKYTQIRLHITSAALYFDNASATGPCAPQIAAPAGTSASVEIPSGEVKLNNEFTVASTGTTILLDFDGDQSVHQTGSGNGNGRGNSSGPIKYMMAPVIRVVSVQ